MSGLFLIAVYALVELGRSGSTMSSEELAGRICTNPARLRKVMAMLHRAGLVETRAGKHGGYCAARDAAKIPLWEVCRAVEEQPVSIRWKTGEIDTPCLLASGMAGAVERLQEGLNAVCAAYLSSLTVADLDRMIFSEKETTPCNIS